MDFTALLVFAITGVFTGLVYGLMGMGLSVVLGTLRIVNIADGALIMLGMYLTFWAYTIFGIFPFIATALIAIAYFGIGMLFQLGFSELPVRLGIRDRDAVAIVGTTGLAALLEGIATIYWSANVRQVLNPALYSPISLGILTMSAGRLYAAVITVAIYASIFLFFKRTYVGLSIRAMIEDRTATSLMGVRVAVTSLVAGGLGIALTGIASSLLSTIDAFYPSVGWQFLLYAFVVVALGGMGNIAGSLTAGVVIGVVESMTIALYNTLAVPVVFLGIFLVVLVFKPEGIFS